MSLLFRIIDFALGVISIYKKEVIEAIFLIGFCLFLFNLVLANFYQFVIIMLPLVPNTISINITSTVVLASIDL